GTVYELLGKYLKAIEYFEKSLNIAKEIGDRKTEGDAYRLLGSALKLLGEYDKAIEYYEKSLSIAIAIDDKRGEGNSYGELGSAYSSIGEYHKAVDYYEKSLRIAKKIGNRDGEGSNYVKLGNANLSLGECLKGIEYYEKGLSIAEEIGDRYGEGNAYVNLGIAYRSLGEYLKAIGCYEKSLTIAKEIGDRYGEAETYHNIGFLYQDELSAIKDLGKSKEHLKKSLQCFEELFGDLKDKDQFKVSIADTFIRTYKLLSRVYINTGQIEEALLLNVREGNGMKCEDRSMELLENEDLECDPSTNSSKLNESVLKCFRKVDRCIPDEEDDDVEPLDMLFLRLVSPMLHQLTHDEVIIIPDGSLFMVPFAALQDPETGKYLSETKRIRLAPSLTTLKLLQESSNDLHGESGALIIGNPSTGKVMYRGRPLVVSDLPGAEEEAVEIGELLGVHPLIGKQATKEVILERLKQGVSVIHFAAHGSERNGQIFLAPSKPSTNSCPAEEKDCILTVKEAQESGIRAQLVVLSCCHSGKGDIRSEGVVGMARAFLAAGARAVVASLWAIDDTATKFFMMRFYSHLKEGESASASLQQAMKETRETGIYEKPMYWAGFFLIGDDATITV
ncbi:Tetratricopeptide repeat protein 28, partial [Exaiptasia diaphana]